MTDVRLYQHGRDHRPGGSDPIPGLVVPPRLVYGCVFNDGGVDDVGSGDWEVVWDGVNKYTFTVSPSFNAAINNVVATGTNNTSPDNVLGAYFVIVDKTASDVNLFIVYTFDVTGDPDSGGFAFVAVEDPA